MVHYLDNFFCVGPADTEVCNYVLRTFEWVTRLFGVLLVRDKTEGPTTCLSFLGLEIDSTKGDCKLPLDKLVSLSQVVGELKQSKKVTLKQLQSPRIFSGSLSRVHFNCMVFVRKASLSSADLETWQARLLMRSLAFLEIFPLRVKNMESWTTPSLDMIHAYWLRKLTAIHEYLAAQMNHLLVAGCHPDWLTQGRTVLIMKDPHKDCTFIISVQVCTHGARNTNMNRQPQPHTMKLLQVLSFLVQLLLCTAFTLPHKPPYRLIDCDGLEAAEAALAALEHINRNHNHGYKYTLNRIEGIKAQTLLNTDELFFLEIDLLETKCPSVSPTPVAECIVRPISEQAVEADCDVKMQKVNGSYSVLGIRCKSELESAENMCIICPTSTLLAPLNDTQVIQTVDLSVAKFNTGNNTHFYHLHEIGRAQIQGPPINRVSVEFIVAATNCSQEDANIGESACVIDTATGYHYAACHGSQQGIEAEVNVQCTKYDPQPVQVHVQNVPVGPPHPKVPHAHFFHNLQHSNLGPHSSESSSAEHHNTHGNHAAKRSLTGEPVLPNDPKRPLCPGKKRFF
ncbi:alpha-2-HS-glycoprotein [Pelodytes ibericus]